MVSSSSENGFTTKRTKTSKSRSDGRFVRVDVANEHAPMESEGILTRTNEGGDAAMVFGGRCRRGLNDLGHEAGGVARKGRRV